VITGRIFRITLYIRYRTQTLSHNKFVPLGGEIFRDVSCYLNYPVYMIDETDEKINNFDNARKFGR